MVLVINDSDDGNADELWHWIMNKMMVLIMTMTSTMVKLIVVTVMMVKLIVVTVMMVKILIMV